MAAAFDSYILAGGRSLRFGSNKAFAEIDGVPLVGRIQSALAEAGSSRVSVVTSEHEPGYDRFEGLGQISDIFKGRGALGGIHAALSDCGVPTAFVVACDYPFITADLVRFLLRKFHSSPAGCLAPFQPDGRLQPLCTVFDVAGSLLKLQTLMEENRETPSVRTFIDTLRTERVPFDSISDLEGADRFFINVNHKSDLETALNRRDD